MALAIWAAFGNEWEANEKVAFNGVDKTITVNSDVTQLDIRADVFSAWERWMARDNNTRFLFAMRSTGLDPIPGGFTGDTYFVTNGWKLVYDPRKVAISGVLYSDDYDTAYYYFEDGSPIYPATVSSLVNTAVSYQNVVTGDLSAIIADLIIMNEGIKKASILVPHTQDIA